MLTRIAHCGFIVLLALAVAPGCERKSPRTPDAGPVSAEEKSSAAHLGFTEWLERDGQFVVVQRFDRDTDGDGEIVVSFGDHGEMTGDLPSVRTIELPTGEEESWDEFVAAGLGRRWVVLRRGETLVAKSAHHQWKIDRADVRPNVTPCAPARQASVDRSGKWLSYMRRDPARAVVKNLRTGEETEHRAAAELWRTQALPLGWVLLYEIPADTNEDGEVAWPRRRGSCVCRPCQRFATSVGLGPYVGDEWRAILVSPDGSRIEGFTTPLPVADDVVWSVGEQKLYDLKRAAVEIKPGARCKPLVIPYGESRLAVRCGTKPFVWDAADRELLPVETPIDTLALTTRPHGDVVGVIARGEGGRRIGRLSLADGTVDFGPPVVLPPTIHASGWALTAGREKTYAFDLTTGTTTTIGLRSVELGALTAKTKDGWITIDPVHGRIASFDDEPLHVASNGCAVQPQADRRPVRGPFRLVCPTEAP